jgi:hypothetical protein
MFHGILPIRFAPASKTDTPKGVDYEHHASLTAARERECCGSRLEHLLLRGQ